MKNDASRSGKLLAIVLGPLSPAFQSTTGQKLSLEEHYLVHSWQHLLYGNSHLIPPFLKRGWASSPMPRYIPCLVFGAIEMPLIVVMTNR